MDYGATRFLFAGAASAQDGRRPGRRGRTRPWAATQACSDLVLQVPRSGAERVRSPELLRSAAPSVAVISAAAQRTRPAPVTLHRLQAAGAEIRRTDTLGTIIVLTDGRSAPTVTAERL